jgi:hypothetical protein
MHDALELDTRDAHDRDGTAAPRCNERQTYGSGVLAMRAQCRLDCGEGNYSGRASASDCIHGKARVSDSDVRGEGVRD